MPYHLPDPDQDDPSAPGYDAWCSLIGHLVGSHESVTAFRRRLVLYEVAEARITAEAIYFCLRRWPGDASTWVGGQRMGMYSMMRRRCGGFQVAGERFVLVGSPTLPKNAVREELSPELDGRGRASLDALLDRPRHRVLPDPSWSRLPRGFGLSEPAG
ncbi:MAG: hypothetical protein ACIAS6_14475 [Phycisphaerales bacterium JB060]